MQIVWPFRAEPPVLEADETHVWAVRLNIADDEHDGCRASLSADESQRAAEFQVDGPRRQYIVTRAALRTLLGKYLDQRPESICFRIGPQGKPQLVGEEAAAELKFNVSHSGDLALIVVTLGAEVGVDVEQVRNVSHLEQIAKRYFHPEEAAEVLSAQPAARGQAFFRCWTAKEAVLKAVGSGLSGRLDTFRVPTTEHEPCWIDLHDAQLSNASRCWLQQLAPCEGYSGATADVDVVRRARCYAYST
jgi:4'-phosphopantetheinyl transferase